MIEFDQELQRRPQSAVKIKVIGVGGAGGNTVNSMIEAGVQDVDFVVANTDMQALQFSKASYKIQLGAKTTKGLGSGANPDLGRRATEEDLDKVMEALGDADIVFIAAGMGGGTGSGGAPVVAKALKERGILSIAVVTKPFMFEGRKRGDVAHDSLERLKKEVDTLIVVPNQRLLELVDRSVSMIEAFGMVNEVIIHSVKSISDIITRSGHINVDFADLRATMKGMGLAIMGTGSASGENRAREAAKKAISSPLLENMDIKGAKGVLLNITGGPSLSLHEINDAASVIYDESDNNAQIILGSVIDPLMGDEVIVSVIATGFEEHAEYGAQPKVEQQQQSTQTYSLYQQPHVQKTVPAQPVMEEILLEEVQAQPVKHAVQEPVIVKKEATLEKENEPVVLLDVSDLDIPAFMRAAQQEELSEE